MASYRPLNMESGADGMALSFADLFLNLSICLMLAVVAAGSTLSVVDAASVQTVTDAPSSPQSVIIVFDVSADGQVQMGQEDMAQSAPWRALDADDQIIAVFPASIPYRKVADALRVLAAQTPARLGHKEYEK